MDLFKTGEDDYSSAEQRKGQSAQRKDRVQDKTIATNIKHLHQVNMPNALNGTINNSRADHSQHIANIYNYLSSPAAAQEASLAAAAEGTMQAPFQSLLASSSPGSSR